jgi:NAD(P)-dependent dehydrogenase (short-subunit alcohol dehydrogenase family)
VLSATVAAEWGEQANRRLKVTQERRRTALVTGGSRGIGAATATALAAHGYDVALTYRNKQARADRVADAIAALGMRALPVQCDITQPDEMAALYARIAAWSGKLDALILNASGGMERDLVAADPDYPMRINRDAQLAALDGALPLMTQGGVVVFITSHWAYLYGQVEQIPAYEPVAASKHAGEAALRARMDDLVACGVRLIVVTGDLIEGTITPKLLERTSPGLEQDRRATLGPLPTAQEMGQVIADAAVDSSLPSGHLIVIGAPLASLLIPPSE